MKLPLRIFSDLHLGHRASRIGDVESLRPLFRGAGTVLFNGDTWEELSPQWREHSGQLLARLRLILAEEACDAVFLPGNHDPGWDGVGFMELAGGRIIITHGDALLRDGAPWKREMLAGRSVVDALWASHPAAATDPAARHELARAISKSLPNLSHPQGRSLFARALDAAFPPQRAIAMLHAWITQGKLGALFCERYFPAAEMLVVGHFHCRGIRQSRGRTVINTGSFVVPGPAGWVEWDGIKICSGRIRERGVQGTLMEPAEFRRKFI
ncbi:metallophosphoesterase family protein [Akkermansiaceae bacterium]|nr:metallophosphoesterase family protein [Akkermansiaceae bacterium]